jgi:hypothetical protein
MLTVKKLSKVQRMNVCGGEARACVGSSGMRVNNVERPSSMLVHLPS